MFSYIGPEDRVPQDHPLREIAKIVNQVLREMSRSFDAIYSPIGRASIPPERLLRALILQALYGIRSERQLVEQINYNILFRWFIGLNMDDAVWHATTFTKNRDRLIEGEIAREFFVRVREVARMRDLMSDDHFTVDGTLIEAWASQKSFKPKNGNDRGDDDSDGGSNPSVDFRGTRRTNETHESTTDPDARLYKKASGTASRLCFMKHALMENRNGLLVDVRTTRADGTAERRAAIDMIDDIPGVHRITVGADKAYDTDGFVHELRDRNVTPHVAANTGRRGGSAIDGRTVRHDGYAISQRKRKLVEQGFGWDKAAAGIRKVRHRGLKLVDQVVTITAAAYNILRISRLVYTTQ